MRLHIGVLCPKDLLRPVDRQILNHICELAAAIITLGWITFGVFVRKNGSRSL